MRTGLIVAGGVVAVVALVMWTKRANAAASTSPAPGFGAPGFVATPTPTAPASVIGCSFVRAGNQLLDANTGKSISEEEAARRAKAEGCTVPPKPTKATKPGQSLFAAGGK